MNTNLCCNYAQKLKAQADGVDRKVVALVVCFNGPLHEYPTPRELLNKSFIQKPSGKFSRGMQTERHGSAKGKNAYS